jgi:hypothetical protein
MEFKVSLFIPDIRDPVYILYSVIVTSMSAPDVVPKGFVAEAHVQAPVADA